MLSEEQYQEILARVENVVNLFLQDDINSIADVVDETGIPRETVRRDLKDVERIAVIYKKDAEKKVGQILAKLAISLADGKKRGGRNFAENNVAKKDEMGRFNGSRKK